MDREPFPTPTTDDMRALVVAILDKLNQLEDAYKPLMHKAESQAAIAEIHAWRVTARGYLARLRTMDADERERGGLGTSPPADPHGPPRAGPSPGKASPRDFQKNSPANNGYRERNQ